MPTTLARPLYSARFPSTTWDAGRMMSELQRIEAAMPTFRWRVVTPASSSADRTMQAGDGLLLVDATLGALSLTVPDPSRVDGAVITVKKTDASAHAVTFGPVDGATVTLASQYQAATITAANGQWFLLNTI